MLFIIIVTKVTKEKKDDEIPFSTDENHHNLNWI